jgi:transaldolase
MLLVNGIRPIQTNYNNQTVSKANFKQSQFQSKADSVSFSAKLPVVKTEVRAQVIALTQRVYAKYADVCGFKNFKPFYERAVNLFSGDVKIYDEILNSCESATVKDYSRHGESKAYQASLISMGESTNAENLVQAKSGDDSKTLALKFYEAIHEPFHSEIDVTQEAANVRLLDSIFSGKMEITIPENSLKEVKYSTKLKEQAARLVKALDEFKESWFEIPHSDDNAKLKLLKEAYDILLLGGKRSQ